MQKIETPIQTMHWYSPDGEKFRVEFIKGPIYSSINDLRNRAFELHRVGLNYNPMKTAEQLLSNMQTHRGGSIFFASTVGPDAKDVGYVTERVMELPFEEGKTLRVLFVSTKVFLPEYQGKGLGAFFTEQANLLHSPIDAFICRTQNTHVILSYRRTELFEKILPVDELYGDSTEDLNNWQIALESFAKRTGNIGVDLRTGLVKGVYPTGEARAFVVNSNNPEDIELDRTFQNRGVVYIAGDGLLVMAIKKKIIPSHQTGKILTA